MRRLQALCLGAVAAALSIPCAAHGDDASPSDEQKAAARLLGTEGVRLAMSGDCSQAVDKLTRAEALVHAPTTAVWLGQCDIQLGHLVAGTEVLNRVVRDTLPPGAPKSWVEAKQRAQSLFDSTEPRIGKLIIAVDRPGGVVPQVTVDGNPVPSVLVGDERPTDPGAHHVVAVAPGFDPASTDVTLADGQSLRVSLQLVAQAPPPSPQGAPVAPGPGPQPAPATGPTSSPASSPPNRTAAYVTYGVGAAGFVVTAVFGVLALGDKSRLDSAPGCPKSCPESSQSDIDALHRDALISTIGLGVGIVGAALGTYFFVSAHSDEAPKTAKLDVRPWIGPASAGLGGTFP
jgi:hypothetical protein